MECPEEHLKTIVCARFFWGVDGGGGKCIMDYSKLLKTGSLDNAIREFWLAKPSWVMSHYTMIYKHGKYMRDILGLFIFIVV